MIGEGVACGVLPFPGNNGRGTPCIRLKFPSRILRTDILGFVTVCAHILCKCLVFIESSFVEL